MDVGEKLRYARKRAGLTISEVMAQTGIGVSSLSEFENGKRVPSLSQLHALAKAYQRTFSFFVVETPIPQETIRWRKRPQVGAENAESRFLKLCEQFQNLEGWTGEVRKTSLPESKVVAERFGYSDAEALAKNVRNALQLGERPGLSLLSTLEESCGVKVFHLDFEPSGTAASAKSDSFGAAILLNSKNKRWRRNFDLAHELFHLLTWDTFSPPPDVSEHNEETERLATCFARNLLMPHESVRTAIANHSSSGKLKLESLFDIAREFDVSVEALVWHLQFVLSLSKELTERTQDAIKTLAPVEEEREDSPTQTYPERYRSLAMQALQRCEISVGRFAEYLGISRQKAMHYMPQGALNYEEIQVPFA